MSTQGPPPDPVARLQLWPTVTEGLNLLLANLGAMAKLALWPLLLSMAADFALTATFWGTPLYGVLRLLCLNLIWVLFAVGWLRLLLLQDRRVIRVFPQLTPDYRRFTFYTLVIALFDLALQLGRRYLDDVPDDFGAPGLEYWLAFLAISFVKLRFSFVYPAVAAGETYSLALSWRHSAGSSLALFGAQLIAVFIPLILLSYLANALAASPDAFVQILIWVGSYAVMWPLEAAYLAILVVAFRTCTGWVPPPDKAIVERFE
ncbi:hypothetical protein [Pelagibius marinus]|uniref:hypothetical protein n=1 Tax=Pelagibius marinus TaxID=2762760 RepID=UPI00187251DE|nr:hypothetical protein [Pelagibius marinus]